MSRYWIITRETESLLTFNSVNDLVIFLFDHKHEMHRYRILKNKDVNTIEVHLSHLPWSSYREILDKS